MGGLTPIGAIGLGSSWSILNNYFYTPMHPNCCLDKQIESKLWSQAHLLTLPVHHALHQGQTWRIPDLGQEVPELSNDQHDGYTLRVTPHGMDTRLHPGQCVSGSPMDHRTSPTAGGADNKPLHAVSHSGSHICTCIVALRQSASASCNVVSPHPGNPFNRQVEPNSRLVICTGTAVGVSPAPNQTRMRGTIPFPPVVGTLTIKSTASP